LSKFLPSFSHRKIECEPGGVNFTKKRGNGRFAGPQNPPKSYKKAAKSYDFAAFVAKADNIDTGCRFSEEKFCEGINRSAQVSAVLHGLK